MSKNKTIIVLVLILLLVFSLSIACTPQKRPAPAPNPRDPGIGDTNLNNNKNEKRSEMTNRDQDRGKKVAEKIAQEVKGVNSATVVFSGTMAYVGLDLHANYTGNEAENVKKEVARIVKKDDSKVKTVYVTEDADTFTRLQKIGRDIEGGKPISGFLEELQNMFKRVTPSME